MKTDNEGKINVFDDDGGAGGGVEESMVYL